MRTIEIDFDVHKLIESDRQSFDETPNDVIRRLLGIDQSMEQEAQKPNSEGRAWTKGPVVLPHGTKLKASYNGAVFEGEVCDGKWVVEGKTFSSPSGAIKEFARTKKGGRTTLNGKAYFEVKRPNDKSWISYRLLERREKGDTDKKTDLAMPK